MKGVKTMKRLILLAVLLLVTTGLFAQGADVRFVPKTLTAGTSMSARSVGSTFDDTTQSILVKGYSYVGISLVSATNDSVALLVSVQGSTDGYTFGSFRLIDSLSSTGTVGVNRGIELNSGGYAFTHVRFRVYNNTAELSYSSSPSTTVTVNVAKKPSPK
jgi:hypothetical protein